MYTMYMSMYVSKKKREREKLSKKHRFRLNSTHIDKYSKQKVAMESTHNVETDVVKYQRFDGI